MQNLPGADAFLVSGTPLIQSCRYSGVTFGRNIIIIVIIIIIIIIIITIILLLLLLLLLLL